MKQVKAVFFDMPSLMTVYRYILNLKLPNSELRKLLWERLIPQKAPVSTDVNYQVLAERYVMHRSTLNTMFSLSLSLSLSNRYQFNAGEIVNAINQAAEICAASGNCDALITFEQLVQAAELQMTQKNQRTYIPSIFQ